MAKLMAAVGSVTGLSRKTPLFKRTNHGDYSLRVLYKLSENILLPEIGISTLLMV